MHVDRRTFLKGTAAVGGALGLGVFDLSEARAEMRELKIARTTETRSTCPYCSVSCGVIIHTLGDRAKNVKPSVVHVEGDPDCAGARHVDDGLTDAFADLALLRTCGRGQVDLDVHIAARADLDALDHPEFGDGAAEFWVDHLGQRGANA